MLKKRLQFSRTAAVIVAFGMGASGINSLLFSSAATVSYGSVKVTTYAFVNDQPVPIGSVDIVLESVGGAQKCADNSRQTPSGGDHSATFTNCRVANNGGPKQYRLVSAARDGYSFRSLHINNADMAIGDGNTFPVKANTTTSLGVFMNPPPTFTPPATPPAPPPDSTPSSNAPLPTGSVKLTSYAYKDGSVTPIGNVKVTIETVGGPHKCDNNFGTTNAAGDNSVTLTECQVAIDGGPKTYRLVSAERDNYSLRSLRLYSGGGQTEINDGRFTIEKNKNTSLAVWMTPPDTFVPPATSQPAASAPAPSGSANKNGAIEITTYTYHSEGNITRQGNVKVSISSVGTDNGAAQRCDQIERTTDSAGGSSEANPNYAQANFTNCWTGSGGSKQYEISRLEVPSGYAFRSMRSLDSNFVSGTNNAQTISERFVASANQKTRLSIWMTKVPVPVVTIPAAGPGQDASTVPGPGAAGTTPARPGSSGTGAVHQVTTRTGVSYIPARPNEASRILATLLNSLVNPSQLDPNAALGGARPAAGGGDDDEDFSDDADDPDDADGAEASTPPSAPANLNALQDASGSIALSWTPSTGNPPNEPIEYLIERYEAGYAEPRIESAADSEWVDTEDLKYPQEYTYRVYGIDDDENSSEPVTATITTQALTPNISAAIAAKPTSDEIDDATEPGTAPPSSPNPAVPSVTIESQSLPIAAVIPVSAKSEPMACALSEADDSDNDLLASLGKTLVNPGQLVCRENDGEVIEEFDEDVEVSIEIDEAEFDDSELYAFDGTDWEKIPTSKDGKEKLEGTTVQYASARREAPAKGIKGAKSKLSIKSKKPVKLAVVKKHGPDTMSKLFFMVPPLLLLTGGTLFIINRRQRIPALDSVSRLKDIDLLPTKQNPTTDYVQPLNQVELPDNNSGVKPDQVIRPEGWRRDDTNDNQ